MTSRVPKNRVSRRYSASSGAVPGRLQQRGQEAQPDRHRDEQEVVDRGHRELEPRQVELTHRPPSLMRRRRPARGRGRVLVLDRRQQSGGRHQPRRVMPRSARSRTVERWLTNSTTTSSSSAPARAAARSPTGWPPPASGSCCSSAATTCRASGTTGTPPRSSSRASTAPRSSGTTSTATSSRRRSTTTSAATPSSTAPRCSGCGPRTSASCATTAASRPAWPIGYEDLEPYYTQAEHLYLVHGRHGEDPTEGPASAPVRATRRSSTSRASSSSATTWRSRGCTRSTCRSA